MALQFASPASLVKQFVNVSPSPARPEGFDKLKSLG
jgi:hypothetical protein